jgi:hypothetical protein
MDKNHTLHEREMTIEQDNDMAPNNDNNSGGIQNNSSASTIPNKMDPASDNEANSSSPLSVGDTWTTIAQGVPSEASNGAIKQESMSPDATTTEAALLSNEKEMSENPVKHQLGTATQSNGSTWASLSPSAFLLANGHSQKTLGQPVVDGRESMQVSEESNRVSSFLVVVHSVCCLYDGLFLILSCLQS